MPKPFDSFFKAFQRDGRAKSTGAWEPGVEATGFRDLMKQAAGCSFETGLYRLHSQVQAANVDRLIAEAFPAMAGRAFSFGQDWLGRQFALDSARHEGTQPLVLMLEPGSGDALEIPATFETFHADELLNEAEAALAVSFFDEWRAASLHSAPLRPDQCVGYEVPLFLGGPDEVENLALIDLDVYWTISGQLLTRTRTLPPGTRISSISIA